MPGYITTRTSALKPDLYDKYLCGYCQHLLKDAVQPVCGHWLCETCASELIANSSLICPRPDCGVNLTEDVRAGCEFFPDRFIRREINNMVVRCSNQNKGCRWENKVAMLENHLESCGHTREVCYHCGLGTTPQHNTPQSADGVDCTQEQLVVIRQDLISEKVAQYLQTQLDGIAKAIKNMSQLMDTMEKTMMTRLAEQNRHTRSSDVVNQHNNGQMIWKIPHFNKRLTEAQTQTSASIFSKPFYSNSYGYKMCLRLYIMGDGTGKGTHLSLYIVIMKGEYDTLLEWPFIHKFTFKLFNQTGGRDIIKHVLPVPMSNSFRKPRTFMNIASGCPKFVSHAALNNCGFIVDDTVFIKCVVDTSGVKHP